MRALAFVIAATLAAGPAAAAEFKILTTGAPRKVVDAVAESLAKEHRAAIAQDTAGGVRRRVEAGEAADVIVATPDVLEALAKAGKTAPGARVDFASTGVGIGVKEGLPKPDISTVEAIKRLVAQAPSIALPDPKAGGTSALYIESLFRKLGVAEVVNAKAKLKAGGYAADLVAAGEAVIVFHQISEIRPVKGVTLVGPLPAEIQLTTVYSAAAVANPASPEAAKAFLAAIGGAPGRAAAEAAGMDPVR